MNTARQLAFTLAFVGLLLTSTVVTAQSGTRNPIRSGGSGGSSGGGAGGGSRGFSNNGGGQFSRSLTPQEGALRGYSELVRSAGEAQLRSAQATRELEQARSIYIENQLQVERFRQERRAEKQKEIEYQRELRKKRRLMAEMDSKEDPMDQWKIQWPTQLEKSRYAGYRTEIRELSILYAKLEHNSGIEVGLKNSIRDFAQKIKQDESDQLLSENDSEVVRTFVRELYQTNGQNALMRKMDGMLADH